MAKKTEHKTHIPGRPRALDKDDIAAIATRRTVPAAAFEASDPFAIRRALSRLRLNQFLPSEIAEGVAL